MDHKTVSLVGVISALTPLAATAAPSDATLAEVMSPQSYAELLKPIPNASALLREQASSQAEAGPRVQTAQYYGYPDGPYYHHHHHHHHHHQYRSWDGYPYYHHHHHHHHHQYYDGWGGDPYYHHHHHHHHHHHNWYW